MEPDDDDFDAVDLSDSSSSSDGSGSSDDSDDSSSSSDSSDSDKFKVDPTDLVEAMMSQTGVDSVEHIADFVESLDEN